MIPEPKGVEVTVVSIGGTIAQVEAEFESHLHTLTKHKWHLLQCQAPGTTIGDLGSVTGEFTLFVHPEFPLTDAFLEKVLWPFEQDVNLAAVVINKPLVSDQSVGAEVETICLRTSALDRFREAFEGAEFLPDLQGVAIACAEVELPVLSLEQSTRDRAADQDTDGAAPRSNDQLMPTRAEATHIARGSGRLLLAVLPWMTVGGADRYNLDILTHARENGWELTIVTTAANDDEWEPRFAELTGDIHRMSRFVRPVDYPSYLKNLVASRSPDVALISNSETGYLLLPFLRHNLPGTAFVDLVHAEQPEWKDGGYARYSALYRDHIDLTVTVSDHLARWMVRAGAAPDRVHTCRAGVDPDWWSAERSTRSATLSRLGLDPATVVVTFNGRLAPLKQPDIFLEALAYANQRGAGCSAIIVGDGELRKDLEALASELEIDAATVGAVDRDTVRSILRATDIALLPSRAEGISIALLEAMACGVPVISADVGGQAELVTSETGILIEPSTRESEIAVYGEAALELARDRELREQFGREGRTRVLENFTVEKTGARFVELLETAQSYHAAEPLPASRRSEAELSASGAVSYLTATRHSVDLEVANAWLRSQVESWKAESGQLADQVSELKAWIAELEAAKTWLENQMEAWKATAERQTSTE